MRKLKLLLALLLLCGPARASITYVQGASGYTANSGTVTVGITPTAANHCLILSVGMYSTNDFWNIWRQQTETGFNFVGDTQSNPWVFVGTSPVQFVLSPSDLHSAVSVFTACNVAVAATTITIQTTAQYVVSTVDEYSGVANIRAVDGINFNSTAYGSGLSSIASGSIAINGTETVYSVGFTDTNGETFTASAGYTPRQAPSTAEDSIATFDQSFTGGTASNTVSVGSTPGSIHVIVLALSPTSVPSIVLQQGWMIDTGTVTTYVTVPMPYAQGSGHLLVLTAYVYERTAFTVTDTVDDAWVVPINAPSGPGSNLVMVYCLSSKPGANAVLLTGTAGGDDVTLSAVVTEYNIQNAAFTASSVGSTTPGSSVNTGSISVGGGSLLVSMAASDGGSGTFVALAKMGSSPNTWRIQPSDGVQTMNAEADEIVSSAGSYSNTFTASSSANYLYAGILGFGLSGRHRAYVIHSK